MYRNSTLRQLDRSFSPAAGKRIVLAEVILYHRPARHTVVGLARSRMTITNLVQKTIEMQHIVEYNSVEVG